MKETFPEKPDTLVVAISPGTVHTTVNYDVTQNADGTWSAESVIVETVGPATKDSIYQAIAANIDAQTDGKILTGFRWHGKNVYLSTENQFNFKAAYDVAVQTDGATLPVKFKLGEDADGLPMYHTFNSMNAFTDFYTGAISFIQQTLAAGWEEKDAARDWVDSLEL